MRHLKVYESFEPTYDTNYNPKDYKILNPGQIAHYRQVFRLRPAREVDYVWKVLDTIEKNNGRASLKQWNVIQRTYRGGNYPVNY